ncbi:hypothetical protein MHBO_002741 [Bonamia ostreae]|uniref:Uncharacterized protein n=1 Tax=Bonamia ostreae TaxID=126728 RepID=A0ABV2APA7_9EUKA
MSKNAFDIVSEGVFGDPVDILSILKSLFSPFDFEIDETTTEQILLFGGFERFSKNLIDTTYFEERAKDLLSAKGELWCTEIWKRNLKSTRKVWENIVIEYFQPFYESKKMSLLLFTFVLPDHHSVEDKLKLKLFYAVIILWLMGKNETWDSKYYFYSQIGLF